ncbi:MULTISPECIES: hypothetical protein [unclassified Mesorhizobium]|uniref:hypothetical protein n=1 Tax=unclassified Mesorhizobium TaxID=325217 RepID=UPI002415747D|nr:MULTISPECIES: hypothetical protein [unclassified Mesorhizobium]MDG4854064.1 hypothetical protein [Mesorhizobium sp. WSM4982]MDG4910920.1 hypothetical protein [Mesorhizobium sp. WSM4983]
MSNDDRNPVAANDNRRGPTGWPLREQFNRGELGISEAENRRHFFAAGRFRRDYEVAGAYQEDRADEDWRELLLEATHLAGFVPIGENGNTIVFDEAAGDWKDGGEIISDVVDNGGFNLFRDLPYAAGSIQARQVIALAADVLGSCYPIIVAGACRNWTLLQLGETEADIGSPPATLRSIGKGLLRVALRDLSAFYVKLDRAEAGEATQPTWPLVGTPAWRFADMPTPAWRRGETQPAWTDGGAFAYERDLAA